MATYLAVTTLNSRSYGWRVVGIGATRAEAAWQAHRWLKAIDDRPDSNTPSLYWQTYERNMRVMGQTTAIRQGYLSRWQVEEGLTDDLERAEQEMRDWTAAKGLPSE